MGYPEIAKSAENNPKEPAIIIRPASKTPRITEITVSLKLNPKRLAAKVPVQAPVPGSGIPTNKSNAIKNPFPAFS